MKYSFNNDFILRFEFFGGMLIDKKNYQIYTVTHGDSIFLDCIKKGYTLESSVSIVNTVLALTYNPEISEMIDIGVLCKNGDLQKTETYDYNEEIKNYRKFIEKIKNRKYLSAPIEVSIYPSSICQLNCDFCYYGQKRNYYKENLSADNWIDLIDEIKESKVLYLSILGGEPTLYKDIDAILKHVDEIKFKTTITTNGVFIKKTTFDLICNSKYITPAISLQSLNELNTQLMGVHYKKIVRTINNFIKNNKIPRINTVYTRQRKEDIFQVIDFCVENGISEYYVNAFMPVDNNTKYYHKFSDYKKLNDEIGKYIEKKNYSNKINVMVQGCLLFSAYYNELESPVNSEYERLIYGCEAGATKLEIMPNGDALPCTAFGVQDFDYENVFDKPFIQVWNDSEYLKFLRNYKIKDKRCKTCKFCDFCNGGCPAYNLHKNNNIESKGDERCAVNM